MFHTDINLLAVVLGVVTNMVIGFVWYSPMVFGNTWMKLVGKKKQDLQPDNSLYIYMIIGSLVTSFIMAVLILNLGARSGFEGAQVGLLSWLGFVAPTCFANYAFAGRPRNLWLIDTGYYLVSFLVMGFLIGSLQ